jgi:hypothetical protein
MLELASTLNMCETPLHRGFAAALKRLDRMRYVAALTFVPGRLVIKSDGGEVLGEVPFDANFTFNMSIEGARLLAECGATHVDIGPAIGLSRGETLRFSRGGEMPLLGMLGGRS